MVQTFKSESVSTTDKPKKKRGRRGPFALDAQIEVLRPDARRNGTKAKKLFSMYRSGMPVSEALHRGISFAMMRCDVRRGNINIK